MAIDPAQQPLMIALGRRILTRRESLQLTGRDIQHATGISISTLSRIENGTIDLGPRFVSLNKLAIVLKMPLTDLLQDSIDYVNQTIQ